MFLFELALCWLYVWRRIKANCNILFLFCWCMDGGFSPFMGEFIYSGHPWPSPFGPVFNCLNPLPADLVFWIIYSNQRQPPHYVGLRRLCALQSEPGAVNYAALFPAQPSSARQPKRGWRSKPWPEAFACAKLNYRFRLSRQKTKIWKYNSILNNRRF